MFDREPKKPFPWDEVQRQVSNRVQNQVGTAITFQQDFSPRSAPARWAVLQDLRNRTTGLGLKINEISKK